MDAKGILDLLILHVHYKHHPLVIEERVRLKKLGHQVIRDKLLQAIRKLEQIVNYVLMNVDVDLLKSEVQALYSLA
jgi:hypothetical protein